jgi:hypothetical protein
MRTSVTAALTWIFSAKGPRGSAPASRSSSLDRLALARGQVFELVAADAADVEVLRLRMREVEAAHARGRMHRVALGQRHADLVGIERSNIARLTACSGQAG